MAFLKRQIDKIRPLPPREQCRSVRETGRSLRAEDVFIEKKKKIKETNRYYCKSHETVEYRRICVLHGDPFNNFPNALKYAARFEQRRVP